MRCLLRSSFYLLGVILALGAMLARPTLSATRDPEKVRVGYSVGGLIPFPVVVARENKMFERLGLDVELINIPPTLAVTALVSGDLQYVVFAGTTLNAAVRGLPVKLVMIYNDRPLFSLMSRPEIRSVKELKGKVLGIASLTSGESFLSRRLLKEAGIDPEREVILRTIGNTPGPARRSQDGSGGRDDAYGSSRHPGRKTRFKAACLHGRDPRKHQRRHRSCRSLDSAKAGSDKKNDYRSFPGHGARPDAPTGSDRAGDVQMETRTGYSGKSLRPDAQNLVRKRPGIGPGRPAWHRRESESLCQQTVSSALARR
jgi:hypothetical protein